MEVRSVLFGGGERECGRRLGRLGAWRWAIELAGLGSIYVILRVVLGEIRPHLLKQTPT